MHVVGGVVLWFIATICGLLGAGWLGLAGVGWNGGFIERSYWDESESAIGVAFGGFLLVVWLGMLSGAFAVTRGGHYPPTRVVRSTSTALTILSVFSVVLFCVLTVGWPEPPSEFPTPEWNRA